jgi:hypothetical protein
MDKKAVAGDRYCFRDVTFRAPGHIKLISAALAWPDHGAAAPPLQGSAPQFAAVDWGR